MVNMKEYTHLILATGLLILTFIIQILTQQDSYTKRSDVVKLYTLERHKGDPTAAANLITSPGSWLTDSCANLTTFASDATCRAARISLTSKILSAVECDVYKSSPTCAYLIKVLSSISSSTNASATSITGKSVLNQQATLSSAVLNAPLLFHNSYKATQKDSNWVVRSTLYTLIAVAIFSNLSGHILEQLIFSTKNDSNFMLRVSRWVIMCIPLFFGVATSFTYGQAANIMLLILIPPLVILLWYELMLPKVSRPWVHPYTFALIFNAVTILALVENGVTNYNIVITEGLKAQVINFLYISVVWFFFNTERGTNADWGLDTHFHALSSAVIVILSVLMTFTAPYAYTVNSFFLLAGPAIFLTIALGTTLWVLSLHLSQKNDRESKWWSITPVKLASSNFLLLFGWIYGLIMFAEHISNYRASQDIWPTTSINYDPAIAWVVGAGSTLTSGP